MVLVANWKAYVEDLLRAQELFVLSKRLVRRYTTSIVLAPPATFLGALSVRNTSSVTFAAQDISATTGGAHTGELVAQAYAATGATYALVGHSERRAAGDVDSIVAAKLAHTLAHGLTPILCVGEGERDGEGKYLSFIREQLRTAFAPLTLKERKKIILAYEPVWAINKTATESIHPNDLTEMVLYLRKVLSEYLLGKGGAQAMILYGGSVEAENIRVLAATSGIDGFLIGHASVDPVTFSQLVKALG